MFVKRFGKNFGKSKLTMQDSRLDQFSGELLGAVRVSEEEVAKASSSSYLYDRVRMRIAEIGERSKQPSSVYDRLRSFNASLLSAPRFVVLSSALAILLVLAAGLFVLFSGPRSTEFGDSMVKAIEPSSPVEQNLEQNREQNTVATVNVANDQPHRAIRLRRQLESRGNEIATDFLPLTFVDDSSTPQNGHIVRMKVSRSALIAFGVPMNMERAGELITADVMIGDDGLARAIRFVQ